MRYGYAVFPEQCSDFFDDRIFFENIIQIDKMFIDYGSSRRQKGALLRTLDPNDMVVVSNQKSVAMSDEEFLEFRLSIREKKARLSIIFPEPEPVQPVDVDHSEKAETKRGRKEKSLNEELFAELLGKLKQKEISKKEMAAQLGVCYATLEKKIRKAEI